MIHVAALRIPSTIDRKTLSKLMTLVSEEKRTKMLRYKFESDLIRTLLAEVLLRMELCERLRIPNSELIFLTNPYGKPYLDRMSGCSFNLAHSGSWVCCAIGQKPIGIDVEQIRSIDFNIAKRYFSALEYKDLISQEEPSKYFFDLWSLKESYIKMIGKGLFIPLDSFTVRKEGDRTITLTINGSMPDLIRDVKFNQYDIDPDYRLAVCSTNGDFPERCATYQFAEFQERALQLGHKN